MTILLGASASLYIQPTIKKKIITNPNLPQGNLTLLFRHRTALGREVPVEGLSP